MVNMPVIVTQSTMLVRVPIERVPRECETHADTFVLSS
jgi:hypothetical protein